ELVARHRRALAELDPGHDLLAVLLRRHPDDLDVRDVGMRVQEFLDLARVDVLAAANDHVFDPADDVDVPLFGHGCDVACVHPARGVHGKPRCLIVVPVAAHHDVATAAQLAGFTARDNSAGGGVDHLNLDVGMHPADC